MRRRGIAAEEVGWLQPALNNARYRAEDNGIILEAELLHMPIAGNTQQHRSAGVLDVTDDIAFPGDVAAECENLSHLGSAVFLAQLVHSHDSRLFVPKGEWRYAE